MIRRPRKENGAVLPSPAEIMSCVEEHMEGLGRLNMLRDYYDGRSDIRHRKRPAGMPNNRMNHGFARYISVMAAGYLIGSPVGYSLPEDADDGARETLAAALKAYADFSADSVDAELARCASIYGKGVELLFADETAQPRSVALDPRSAFVVYDTSAEAKALYGVQISENRTETGGSDGYSICVYAPRACCAFRGSSPARLEGNDPLWLRGNPFGGVPMVEYWNGEDEQGDFESVLSLIDAYDLLQSDRMNDKQQFVDALLLLYGCTLETDERGRTPGQQLREDKVLSLPDSDARAEWLCKQLNEADTEVLRSSIVSDIHKMSMVPDMTDEAFSGNVSGVAMRYKLLGLEQLTKIKERWFREALRERMRRMSAFLQRKGYPGLDAAQVRMSFARSLPVNQLETAQTIEKLRGLVSDDRLIRLAGFLGE